MTQRTADWIGLALLLAGMIYLATINFVQAHDHKNAANNEWLKSLYSRGGAWCCDGNDTDDIEDWDTKGGKYRVKWRGQWFDVPDEALVDGPNKGGGALLWMNKGWGDVKPRCFMPGTLS